MKEHITPPSFNYLDILSNLHVDEKEIKDFRNGIPKRMKKIFDKLNQEDKIKLIAINNLSDEEFIELKKLCKAKEVTPIIHGLKASILALSNYTNNSRYL